jgi:hypothetical protein
MEETRVCPSCGEEFTDEGAISRADNSTIICLDCSNRQAFMEQILYLKDNGCVSI